MVWYGEKYAEELGISVEYTGKYKNYNSYMYIQRNISILDTLESEILSVIEIYIYPNFRVIMYNNIWNSTSCAD